jgi:hypothetical protein
VFIAGRKGTGKSTLLHRRYVSSAPRVLSLDATVPPETLERNPGAVYVIGLDQLRRVLRLAAGYPRWHIAAALEPADVAELFRLLCPPLGSPRASLSRAFGGIAIECGECDLVWPNAGSAPELLSALRRGRHYLLDLYLATQRPASCAVDVRAQADALIAFAQTEPRDVDYFARGISRPVGELIRSLEGHEFVFYSRADGRVYVCGEDGAARAIYDTAGRQLAGPARRPAVEPVPAAPEPAPAPVSDRVDVDVDVADRELAPPAPGALE